MKIFNIRTYFVLLVLVCMSTTLSSCFLFDGDRVEPECWTCYVDYPNGYSERKEVCNTREEQAFKAKHHNYSPYCY